MSLQQAVSFESPSKPSRKVSYFHLNQGAAHTLLFCYGAGGSAIILEVYRQFLESHPNLSLLSVDRWTQGNDAARAGEQLFSELSAITLELLDFLKIEKFSIAAHSAGAYQLLDLARRTDTPRLENLFFLCTHIPAPYTGSKIMNWMCTMPNSLFKTVTKLDSSLGNTVAGDFLVRVIAKGNNQDSLQNVFVSSKAHQETVSRRIQVENNIQEAGRDRLDIDYRVGYERLEGITNEILTSFYKDCPINPIWFTTDGDVFFGPQSVHRILEAINKTHWEMAIVPEATHADIYFRLNVWERMYDDIVNKSKNRT